MDLMDFQVKKKCPESYALGSWLVKLQPRRGRRGDRPTATTKRSYYGRSNTTNATIQRPRKTPYHSQHYRGKSTRLRRFCPYELQRFPPYDDYNGTDMASRQCEFARCSYRCEQIDGSTNRPLYEPSSGGMNTLPVLALNSVGRAATTIEYASYAAGGSYEIDNCQTPVGVFTLHAYPPMRH